MSDSQTRGYLPEVQKSCLKGEVLFIPLLLAAVPHVNIDSA